MSEYMQGKVVSEEEVAKDLGFASVVEMRRWSTEMGFKVVDLEEKLIISEREAERFRWHGLRMQRVLEKTKEFLEALPSEYLGVLGVKLLLAIDVVCGRGVDWEHRLKGWFEDLK